MSISEAINAMLVAVNVWWMLRLFIGLCEPTMPKRKQNGGTWKSNDKVKP